MKLSYDDKVSKKVELLDNQAANGPCDNYEIHFVPSGNTPEIELGAPPYDSGLAERRRINYMTMKHTIKEKMELYTSSTKGRLEDLKELLETDSKKYSLTEEISK